MTDLSHAFRAHWIERQLVPLDLTEPQMCKFLKERCESAIWIQPTHEYRGGWKVDCESASSSPFRGETLEEAVGKAAAAFKEVNGELKF